MEKIFYSESMTRPGEQRVRRKSKQFKMIAEKYNYCAQIIKMWYVIPFDSF